MKILDFISLKTVSLKVVLFWIIPLGLILGSAFVFIVNNGLELGVLTSNPDKEIASQGVKFLEKDVGGLKRDKLEDIVKKFEQDLKREPKEAYLDPVTKGVIPGLAGRELDVEVTVSKIITAEKQSVVFPEWTLIPPETNVKDYQDYPIYQGNPNQKQVTFACNVAWGTEYIDEMIELLDENHVEISFFLEGRWAKNNPDKVLKLYSHGHEIGNHAYSHYLMSQIDRQTITEEISKTNDVIEEIIEEQPKLFGPPAGDFDEEVLKEASKLDMHTILWSLDTVDWKEPGVTYMIDKIMSNLHPGAIILIHPTKDTVKAMEQMIPSILDKEYEIVTVSNMVLDYK